MLNKRFNNPICQECIKNHLQRYDSFVDDNGKAFKEFSVPCIGIPEKYLSDHLEAFFTPEERLEAIELFDPVVWASNWCKLPDGSPWIARWYQESILRCTAKRRVTRMGRRCLPGNTPVLMSDGTWKHIKDIRPGDSVVSRHTSKNTFIKREVSGFCSNGIRSVYEVRLSNGMSLKVTENHPFWARIMSDDGIHSKKDWLSIEDGLSVGTYVYVMKEYLRFGQIRVLDEAKLLGYLLTDGYLVKEQTPKFTSMTTKYLDEVESIANKFWGYSCSRVPKGDRAFDLYITDGNKGTKNECKIWLDKLGILGQKSHTKRIPAIVYNWDQESVAILINRMFSGDGCVSTWSSKKRAIGGEISLTSCNIGILDDLRLLLLKFGINAIIYKEKSRNCWKIRISDATSILAFFKYIGFVFGKEEQSVRLQQGILKRTKTRRHGYKDLKAVTVKSIQLVGQEEVFDIEVEKDHNFIANGFLVHNTGKTDAIAIHILHYMFTNKNKRVLIIAPYKSQTEEIISRIRGFITSSPKLMASVQRDVSSPFYELRLNNGSRLRGFSSGTKSGSEAAAVRGQDADRIYLDEADYLAEGDLDALIAILNTHQDVELWASSTPTGARSHFWRWCTGTPTYKQFHFPSMVLPFWEQVRAQTEADYIGRRDAWVHEVLAEFGEQEVGVFQNEYVDFSLEEYAYANEKRLPGWTYSIGVDWNSEVGTEMVVVGYNGTGLFRVVDALNIPKQGWTQLAGCEAVISMNAKWLPKFIYVDEGAGATNIELLRKYGYEMLGRDPHDPGSRLREIVKGYNFSSKLEIRDPVTKRPLKKSAKPFLVENACRFFEERRIRLSAFDTILHNQLGNYIIKHRTTSGVPVYGQINEKIGDHRLDAMMLALVGFKLELSDFGKAFYSAYVAVSPGFAKLHGNAAMPKHPGIAEEKKLENKPQSRFEQTESGTVLAGAGQYDVPANVDNNYKVPVYRHGFMTDEEDKYTLRHRLKNMKKQLQRRKRYGGRTNI